MQKVFKDTRRNDSAVRDVYGLTEDIMMENAAAALEREIRKRYKAAENPDSFTVLIITGAGNNGADGMALARRLAGSDEMQPAVAAVFAPESSGCRHQKELAEKAGVLFLSGNGMFDKVLRECTCIIDCLFGSGFHGTLDKESAAVIAKCNTAKAYRIACDIPSGIDRNGSIESIDQANGDKLAFRADVTVTMGALKTALYGDDAKDYTGNIVCADLGISRKNFEQVPVSDADDVSVYLLEKKDMMLPVRKTQAVNKGSFGHVAILMGQKKGASIIAGNAAFAFGAGLVTIVKPVSSRENTFCSDDVCTAIPPELMQSSDFPGNTTAIAIGMGLGDPATDEVQQAVHACETWMQLHPAVSCVIDADMFRYQNTGSLLDTLVHSGTNGMRNIVLTPHPKEFQSLLNICGFGEYTVREITCRRIELAAEFIRKFPGVVLLLKGSNTLVAYTDKTAAQKDLAVDIDDCGCPSLAKGGSGDVLAGLICALLAQGYSARNAAVTGTLAHSIASQRMPAGFGMTPEILTGYIRTLA